VGSWDLFAAVPDGPRRAPGDTAADAVSVGALTRAAKDIIEGAFTPLWVRGEISDFKAHRSGHWYFSLRDADSRLRCVMWRGDTARALTKPADGMLVTAQGQMTVYPAGGDLQLRVLRLGAAGDGLWQKALEETLARLRADGLLEEARKRPLPRVPRCVAVITSPDGAALQDIRAVAARRFAAIPLVVVPARVQGDGAAEEIVAAFERVARWGGADVVILGRGGGAREDLWAFNDERVARAVAACPVPVVAAVGHEVDVTVVDRVADLRAPTPSAAAEAAIPDREVLTREVRTAGERLRLGAQRIMQRRRQVLAGVGGRFGATARRLTDGQQHRLRRIGQAMATAVEQRVMRQRAVLGALAPALRGAAERRVATEQHQVQALAGQLNALSPLAVLQRGFGVARTPGGAARASVADFRAGDTFDLLLRDGAVRATTQQVATGTPLDAGAALEQGGRP
jgi:exodeoxyribonuclease VII large subunit